MSEGPPPIAESGFDGPPRREDTKKTRKRGEVLLQASRPERVERPEPKPEASKAERPSFEAPKLNPEIVARQQAQNAESLEADDDDDAEKLEQAPEELTETERTQVREQLVQAAKAENGEPANPDVDPEQAAADLAAEQLHDRILAGEDIEEAYAHELENLGAEDVEGGELPEDATDAETYEEPADPDTEIVFDRSAEEVPEDELTNPVQGSLVSPAVPPAVAAGYVASNHGGGANTPPPPTGVGGGFGGGNLPPANPFNSPAFNTPPMPNRFNLPRVNRSANTAPDDDRNRYHQANPATMALFGGIVGYLVGRRRGRIKTEKKLMPVQKKLEKQVEDMHWQLHDSEQKLRAATVRKVRAEGAPAVIEKLAPPLERAPAPTPERASVMATAQERAPEVIRSRAPEARQLHVPKAPEHIGQMLIAAELLNKPAPEQQPASRVKEQLKAQEQLPKPEAIRRVETMNRAELLELSETVAVEGSSLRQIYENNLIGEHALRRLVTEHLRGGDIKRALRREIVEREIDFERDPAMRDSGPGSGGQQASGVAGPARLDQMVQRAAASVSGGSDQVLSYAKQKQQTDSSPEKKGLSPLDIGLGGTIVVLSAVIAAMYFL